VLVRDTSCELQNLFSRTYMILNQFNIYPRCSINKKNENHLKNQTQWQQHPWTKTHYQD
jgi:hypothetical protein